MTDTEFFEEKVKESFLKVKEDIKSIKEGFEDKKKEINEIKDKIDLLTRKIDEISRILKNKDQNNHSFFISSIGNKGVSNNQQQSTMINDDQQSTIIHKKSLEEPSLFDESLLLRIRSITDREFSVFLGILELQKEHQEVTYSTIANKLNVTETTVRGAVNRLISKKLPINRERFFNRKVTLTSPSEILNLAFFEKLI